MAGGFWGGLAEGVESGQGVAQRQQALSLQQQQMQQQAELQRQQMDLTLKKYLGESADAIIDKNVGEIDKLLGIAEKAVGDGKFEQAKKLVAPLQSMYDRVMRVATPLGKGDRVIDFRPRFDAILATTLTPEEAGRKKATEGISQKGAELAGGLPQIEGQAEGQKQLTAANAGGTQAAGLTAGAQEAARLNAQANGPAVLPAEKRAIFNNLKGRGVSDQDAFDVASGLATIQFDPQGGQAYVLNRGMGTATPTTNLPGRPTAEQAKALGYADRMANSGAIINEVENAGLDAMAKGASQLPVIGNFIVGEPFQRFEQAQRDWINANLRQESGAVISESEFANARKQYFPQPGDTQKVIEQKRENRRIAEQSMRRSGGQKVDASASAPSPAAPKITNSKVINGKKYVQIEGKDGWFQEQ